MIKVSPKLWELFQSGESIQASIPVLWMEIYGNARDPFTDGKGDVIARGSFPVKDSDDGICNGKPATLTTIKAGKARWFRAKYGEYWITGDIDVCASDLIVTNLYFATGLDFVIDHFSVTSQFPTKRGLERRQKAKPWFKRVLGWLKSWWQIIAQPSGR